MKNVFIGFFIILSLQSVFLSCDGVYMDRVYSIVIENKAEHKIGFYAAIAGLEHTYPDTLINPTSYARPAFPNTPASISSGNPWEYNIKQLPSDTLSIFIFHSDTLETYSWDVVRDDYKVLKRYDLSIEDLQALDFKVPYPPTAAMEGMQMYPPE